MNPKKQLNKPIIVNPKTTDEEWEQIAEQLINDENISDEDYEAEQERVFAGILPIGSQGCTYLQAIALNGEHKGRVIYMDMDCHKPWFVYEDNFLDWYERWLDEIISGVLIKDSPGGFATTRKGDDKELLELYDKASNDESRIEALRGMDKLKAVSDLSSTKLLDLCTNENSEIRYLALRLLTKFNYRKAIFPLTVHLKGNQKDCLEALSYIWLYAGKCKKHWVKAVREILPKVNDEETFNFVGYIFVDTGIDFSNDFRPFASHTNPEIRTSVFYSLGKLNNKRELVDLFILGLNDDVPRVVHATLQALSGVNDERLLESYKRITDRFKTDESYILTNLLHRLKESGFRSQDDFLNKYLKG